MFVAGRARALRHFTRCSQSLAGTVKPSRHVLVVLGEQDVGAWPSHLEKQAGLVRDLTTALREAGRQSGAPPERSTTMVGGASLPLNTPQQAPVLASLCPGDVLVFPDNVVLRGVSATNAARLAAALASAPRLQPGDGVRDAGVRLRALASERCVFVCAHAQRDERCGRLGPAVGRALGKAVADHGLQGVGVFLCSHVGGHKFAGNVLCYPEGDWYGLVTPDDCHSLVLAHFAKGETVMSKWRGRLGMEVDEQEAFAQRACACTTAAQ